MTDASLNCRGEGSAKQMEIDAAETDYADALSDLPDGNGMGLPPQKAQSISSNSTIFEANLGDLMRIDPCAMDLECASNYEENDAFFKNAIFHQRVPRDRKLI